MLNGRVDQMPSIDVLQNSFQKFLMTMKLWETLYMGDGGADTMEEGASCGSVLRSSKARRQFNFTGNPSNFASTSELKELRVKLKDSLKYNNAYKAKTYKPHGYVSYHRMDQDCNLKTRNKAGGFSTSGYDRGNQPCICHHCSTKGHGARMYFRFEKDEEDGKLRMEGKDYIIPDGKVGGWSPNTPIRTTVAYWSAKNPSARGKKSTSERGGKS